MFESGAVKLQMGDVLLDVAAGTPCQFRQDVAAVNVNHGQFVFLGDVAQRVVCSPNIDQLIRYVSCNHLTSWLKSKIASVKLKAASATARRQAQSFERLCMRSLGQQQQLRVLLSRTVLVSHATSSLNCCPEPFLLFVHQRIYFVHHFARSCSPL